MQARELLYYQTTDRRKPFRDWFLGLDSLALSRVSARLERLEQGNFGDFKNIGLGVFELRIQWGPGYRVYFGLTGKEAVLLL